MKARIQNRVKELREVRAGDLVPHPKNWRKHSPAQAAALQGVIRQIGYADVVLARDLGDGRLQIIDGHLRAGLDPDQRIPVLVLDVTESEAEMLLLTLDPIAAMAGEDEAKLAELAAEVSSSDQAVQALIDSLLPHEETGLVDLKKLEILPPPKMTWVLIGIPTVRFGEINTAVEGLAAVDGIILETTANDGGNYQKQD